MPFFRYKAIDAKTFELSGIVEAPNDIVASQLLRDRGLFVVSVRLYREPVLQQLTARFAHVGFSEIVTFTRQLSTMVNAGLPLTESLRLLESQTSNKSLRQVISDILRQIQSGSSFSKAIAKYPQYFSPIYTSLVQAGEAAGMFDNILLRLADNLEKEKEFRGKIMGALIYPIIIVIGMFALMIIMVVFVVPKLSSLYKDLGSDLPFTTKLLVFFSNTIIMYWPILIVAGVLFVLGLSWFKKTKVGVQIFDKVAIKLPVFGPLQKKVILVEFARTTGILIGAGVPILETLSIVGRAVDNYYFKESVNKITSRVEKGASIGDAIGSETIFPQIVSQMVNVGEATGKLDDILGKLSRFFEVEVEQSTKTLTTSLEPLIMVVLGVGVLFIVWSIITPIYGLTSKIQ